MAESTDEDAARFLQSRHVGIIESEAEVGRRDESVEEGESESRLVIAESSKEGNLLRRLEMATVLVHRMFAMFLALERWTMVQKKKVLLRETAFR